MCPRRRPRARRPRSASFPPGVSEPGPPVSRSGISGSRTPVIRCRLFHQAQRRRVRAWPPRIASNQIASNRIPEERAAETRAGRTPGGRAGLGGAPDLRAAPRGGRPGGPAGAAAGGRSIPGPARRLPAGVRIAPPETGAGPEAPAAPARAASPPAGRAGSRPGPAEPVRVRPGANRAAETGGPDADLPAGRAPRRAASPPVNRAAGPAPDPAASRCTRGRDPTTCPAGCGRRSTARPARTAETLF